jgi:hypothetical protein
MQLSLELVETPAPMAHLWEGLPLEQQEALVNALAVLIARAVTQSDIRGEGDYE